jgi:hypothetical protein
MRSASSASSRASAGLLGAFSMLLAETSSESAKL